MALLVATIAASNPQAGLAKITEIVIRSGSDGTTIAEVSADSPILRVRHFHIEQPPRGVVRIIGIGEAYRPYQMTVDDGIVNRLRIGYHPEVSPAELHLVFDLAAADARITGIDHDGSRCAVILRLPARPVGVATSSPIAAPTQLPATPVAEPTPEPVATAAAVVEDATAVAAPDLPDPTPTAGLVPATAVPSLTPTPAAAPTAKARPARRSGLLSAPRSHRSGFRVRGHAAEELTEIVVSHRDDGSTLVRFTADGAFQTGRVHHYELRQDPRHHVLGFDGLVVGEQAKVPQIDDLSLCSLTVSHRTDTNPNQLQVILRLTSSQVELAEVAATGANVVLHLVPPPTAPADSGCPSK